MSTNGGTMPVPQSQSAPLSCAPCNINLDSAASMSVHQMNFHSQDLAPSRWGSSPSSTVSESNNETNNNHQPLGKHHIKAISPSSHQNTIAAADSSDNNPPTPQQSEGEHNNFSNGTPNFGAAAQQQNPATTQASESREMNSTYHGYSFHEPYYHTVEYGHAPPPNSHHISNGQHHQQEYKTVPSSRFHQPPFNSSTHNTQQTNTNPAVQISNNGLSPRVVSSSSPNNNHNSSTSPSQIMHIPPGQPTPSPSPKQCDKCGAVCESDNQLLEHSRVAHSHENGSVNGLKSDNDDVQQHQQQHNFTPFGHYAPQIVKDEPSSDILDLDSQKMVYPPHPDGSLPPMHSIANPLTQMQRHTLMWGHHDAHFIPPHPGYHQSFKPDYHPPTPPIKNEYGSHMKSSDYSSVLPTVPGLKQDYNTIKAEYNGPTGLSQTGVLPPASTIGNKTYVSDISENGSHLTSSPSDFPSTTTPQENGGSYQRSFEPPTSSLPSGKNAPGWKSNEARRPKTYNCTACNKWFTSSGHLKRHYNTTLHKNAVKSSGHPDPATLPISAHHHPQRDPNYVSKRRSHHRNQQNQANSANQQQQQQNGSQQSSQNQIQQQTVVSEPSTKSPDYQTPFSLPSFSSSAALQQGFQQYGSSNLHNVPGNGQAGLSVYDASQQRGLQQILSNLGEITLTSDNHHQAQQVASLHQQQLLQPLLDTSILTINSTQQPTIMQLQQQHINSINSMDQDYLLHINTNTPSYHTTIMLQPNYPNTTGNLVSQLDEQGQEFVMQQQQDHSSNSDVSDFSNENVVMLPSMPSYGSHVVSYDQITSRCTGGAMYSNELVQQPYSPDMAELSPSMTSTSSFGHDLMPQSAALMAPSQSSPTISTSRTVAVAETKKKGKMKKSSSDDKLHYCRECDKTFSGMCYLTQHNKNTHAGSKPYKCKCGKRYHTSKEREEHELKHNGEKPFKCQICPKSFNHKTDLRRHMCLHSGSKPFACPKCDKGFIRKDHMVKHMETHEKKQNGVKKAKSGKKKLNSMNAIKTERVEQPTYDDDK